MANQGLSSAGGTLAPTAASGEMAQVLRDPPPSSPHECGSPLPTAGWWRGCGPSTQGLPTSPWDTGLHPAPEPLTYGQLGEGAAQALGDGLQLLQLGLLAPALLTQDLVLQPLVALVVGWRHSTAHR